MAVGTQLVKAWTMTRNLMKRYLLGAVLLWLLALPQNSLPQDSDPYDSQRKRMVSQQIAARGVSDPAVLQAMESVPRHLFVPENQREFAYRDHPLPIGKGQTISQPYIVAYMTEALEPKPTDRILEIGTGSGYQAAILAELVQKVYTMEIVSELGERARETLAALGYANVFVKIGDGYKGWPEKAPFDGVIVTCAPEDIPQPLIEQLKEGGRMVIPVGSTYGIQKLVKGVKKSGELIREELLPVRFVPMVKEK